jgi:hypothetical protein
MNIFLNTEEVKMKVFMLNKKTYKALEKSIKKWKKIKNGNQDLDRGISSCPLCAEFNTYSNSPQTTGQDRSDDCKHCPICIDTGKQYCEGTPYTLAVMSTDEGDDPGYFKAAKKEYKYLKGLLEHSVVKANIKNFKTK